jgi:hypothetical protein
MAAVAAPYGLLPINLIGGHPYAGALRHIPLGSGNATAIYYGDVVKLDSAGLLAVDTGTDAATPVGVFLGCSYTDATFGKVFRQYYPGSIVASDIMAMVCDDPNALFKAAVCTAGGTTINAVARTAVGNNSALVQNAGSTVTGNSKVAVSVTTATTNTLPVRIVDVVPESTNASGSYTEVIVKWNAGMHQYENATGV